jgi:Family of unknown function (DUF5677)
MPEELPDFDKLSALARELLDSWDALMAQDDLESELRGRTLAQIAVTLGLVRHTHLLGHAALSLLDADNGLAAAPLVRSMYECALTAQWVAQVDGAQEAFFAKQTKQRRNLLESMKSLSLPSVQPGELDEAMSALDEDKAQKVRLSATFAAICDALQPGGKQAYAHYRMMSQLSHPSDILLDHYLGVAETAAGIGRKVPPEQVSRTAWAVLALASLVWAGQAVEYSNQRRPRRALIRRVATRLQIEPVLRSSGPAGSREAR